MIDTWLAQWGLRLPSSNDATLRLQPAEGPELVMERLEGGWLFVVELGLVPSGLPLGVILQLLQVNSPFSSLAPVKLAADDAGRLVLWAEARDGVDDVDALNRLHDRLREGHSRLVPLLEPTGEWVPAQIQTSALVFVWTQGEGAILPIKSAVGNFSNRWATRRWPICSCCNELSCQHHFYRAPSWFNEPRPSRWAFLFLESGYPIHSAPERAAGFVLSPVISALATTVVCLPVCFHAVW